MKRLLVGTVPPKKVKRYQIVSNSIIVSKVSKYQKKSVQKCPKVSKYQIVLKYQYIKVSKYQNIKSIKSIESIISIKSIKNFKNTKKYEIVSN